MAMMMTGRKGGGGGGNGSGGHLMKFNEQGFHLHVCFQSKISYVCQFAACFQVSPMNIIFNKDTCQAI